MKRLLLFFIMISSFFGYSQLPENFETSFPPTGWTTFTNGVGTVQNWGVTTIPILVYPDGGAQSAYVARENIGIGNTSQDWLVTPAITGINATSEIRFNTRQQFVGNAGTIYELRYSTTSQTDISTFTTLQTWTEVQLNAIYDQYEEKVINVATLAGSPNVYFAFVRVFTQPGTTTSGDGWLIDNVRLTVACLAPSAPLTEANITSTSIDLGVTVNGPATQWEVELFPTGGTPTGSGFIVNSMPFSVTGLMPNTTYIVYIRSVCSGGVTSAWIGPFNTQTLPQGLDCSDPIQITTVPYSTTDNTGVYGDDLDGPQGSGCAGGTINYLASDDVVYEFIPSFTGTVSISSTPIQNNSSLFIYSSCASIATSCLNGVANPNNSIREITGFAVTAGQSYFIVISSSAATGEIDYTLIIQRESCQPPTNLAINNLSDTSVDLSWGNPSGATSWEVINQLQGTGIPSGSGVQTNNNTVYTLNTLTPGTNYEYWVRADCNDGTFSTWSGPFYYMTTLCPPTEQCNYVFEVWDTGGNGWQGNTMNVSQNGTTVAVLTGPLPSDGMTRIQVSVPLCNNQPFVLYWNQPPPNSGFSPAQVGVLIIEPTANNIIYTKAPGSGSQNSLLYNGVAQCTPPTCPQPTNITVSGVNSDSALINWSDNAGATQWEVIVQPLGTGYPTGSGTLTGTRPFPATGLSSLTQYEVYVRAICTTTDSSVWSGPIVFTTTPDYCAGDHFYDTGGASGNYSDNENGIPFTICPDIAGNVVTVSFNTFSTQLQSDLLEVFNGNSVSSTPLGSFSGSVLPPTITASDPSGCLTFRFTSNGGINSSGWDATITCGPPPSCPAPINLQFGTTGGINGNEITFEWTEVGTATQWEIIYLPRFSPPPTASDTGTIVNSNPATLVGVPNGNYEIYVRAICSPNTISEWSPIPLPAYASDGLQACATVNIGDVENGVIQVCSTDNCVDLTASYLQTGNTSVYKVESIPFISPFDTDETADSTNITVDDTWSGDIQLPFKFCFFGNVYNNCSVSSNGVVTFNSTAFGDFSPWSFNQTIPNTGFPIKNAIYGVYQDTDPAASPAAFNINYQILGAQPCRVFIFNISNVAQYRCGANVPLQSSQIVLYETSNVIDVYIENRVPCTSWQDGVGVVGIQNNAGTLAYVPPGRNTGAWSASNEAWRFTPDGANNVAFSWMKNGEFYSTDTDINVCINANTNMTAQAIYTSCDGTETVTTQNVLLEYTNLFEPTFAPIDPICTGETFTLPPTSLEGVTGTWSPAIDNTETVEYTFTPDPNQCATPTTKEVIVREQLTPSFIDPAPICAGDVAPVLPTTSDNGITGIWSPAIVDNMTSGQYTFTPDSGQCGVPFVLDFTVLPSCDFNVFATAINLDNCETTGNGEFFNITGSGTDLIGASTNVFPNSNLGTYVQNSGNLFFNGGEVRTFKGSSSNVCGAILQYRIYPTSTTPGSFIPVTLPFLDDCVAGSFPTGGTCDVGDQKWQNIAPILDLTTLAQGNYTIEVYFEVSGDIDSPTDCDNTIVVDSNGNFYKATFAIQSEPTYTFEDPTFCNATDGSITISGFNPSDEYSVTYTDDGVTVGPTTYYANLSGQITLTNLNAGVYTNFNFSISGCNFASTNSITLSNPIVVPTFNPVGPFCAGTVFSLPIVSNEGIAGTWSPAVDNSQTTTYTFTPNANQCAVVAAPYTVAINALPYIVQITPTDFCPGSDATFLIEGSPNATVSYQINGGTVQPALLDSNGQFLITVPTPTNDVTLTTSLIDDGTCTNPLNNLITAVLLSLPAISSIIAVDNIVCIGSDAVFSITGTPNASVTYTVDGGANDTLTLDGAGSYTLTIPSPTANVQVVLMDITNSVTTCTRVLSGIRANVTVITVPVPTVTTTQPTCALQTGTITVTSPLINQLNYPADLFISEVTDAPQTNVSLTYVEIYNGTGAPVDLGAYKLRLFRDGRPTPDFQPILSGTLANDAKYIVKIGTGANTPGIVPNLSIAGFNINNNDNIRLSTLADVDIDVWGNMDGIPFTPASAIGYNYRRNEIGTVLPSVNWNPSDWTVIDWDTTTLVPDYSNVGIYTLFVASYEYILSDGTTSTTQSTVTYSGIAPGDYTIVVHDVLNDCFSELLEITVDPFVLTDPILTFSYTTPVCEDSVNLLPDTSTIGFATGGTFSSTAGLVIDPVTGEINVANSSPETYIITYTFLEDLANCLNAGSSTFEVVIDPKVVATFDPISLCEGDLNTSLPTTSIEGFTGQWTVLGNPVTTIDTSVTPGDYQYTFTPDAGQCASDGILTVTITVNPPATFTPISLCEGSTMTTLPTTSLEGVTGSWTYLGNPVTMIDTNVTPGDYQYTFTPDAGQCYNDGVLTVTITVNPPAMFTAISLCEGSTMTTLPTTSLEGATGAWTYLGNPVTMIDTDVTPGDYQYTFIPDAGQCVINGILTVTITVNPPATFTPISLCEGSTMTILPTTSLEGATGSWTYSGNPVTMIDTDVTPGDYQYTFIPDAGQCVINGILIVTIDAKGNAAFNPVADLCVGSTNFELPTTSLEGYTGTWSPDTIDTSTVGEFTYTFTPDAQFCALPVDLIIKVKPCTIPKGFSPNGDGNNDTWDLSAFNIKKVEVFNRYGLKVYSKTNYTNDWNGNEDNGNELPSGTYYYMLEFNDRVSETGWVYINRGQ